MQAEHVSLAFGVRKGFGSTILPNKIPYPKHWHVAENAAKDSVELRNAYQKAYHDWLAAQPTT